MDGRKVIHYKLNNGDWRSKICYTKPDNDKKEEQPTTQPPYKKGYNPKTDWYDTEKYESYIHYVMGIEREKPKENKTLFNRNIKISWGKLQPELTTPEHQFSAHAHNYSPEKLIDILDNDIATENIEKLERKSIYELEREYKSTNRMVLSDKDNIEQRVNNAFLKGKGLEDITINGKSYKGLSFDESSEQSKILTDNKTFKNYYSHYLYCIETTIKESLFAEDINIEEISDKISKKLGKPNFSNLPSLIPHDYFGLMGGTQNIEVDFKITPSANHEYNLKTVMYINDWYGADKHDVSGNRGTIKGNVSGLKAFFYLQHRYNRKPFATQIIYKSEEKIKLIYK